MSVTLLIGDCRDRLKELADGSVNCCVTSPPYFGLRDYGHGGQMGLEPTPDEFVSGMVEVFREVRRVLRDDGTLWLNIGDSYANGPAGNKTPSGISQNTAKRESVGLASYNSTDKTKLPGVKQKDLIGIPWMLAFALRADGWYLRQEIIWHKPNPMPESVRDRCTKAHEQIFLLSKSPRYYFDAEAIAEPAVYANELCPVGVRNLDRTEVQFNTRPKNAIQVGDTRNKRSVWTVATQPYSEAHFATYPPALIEPCILAGCPKGGTVLDPFGGVGTTGLVADRFGRNAILVELNHEYAALAERRLNADAGMFAEVKAA